MDGKRFEMRLPTAASASNNPTVLFFTASRRVWRDENYKNAKAKAHKSIKEAVQLCSLDLAHHVYLSF